MKEKYQSFKSFLHKNLRAPALAAARRLNAMHDLGNHCYSATYALLDSFGLSEDVICNLPGDVVEFPPKEEKNLEE